MFFVDEAGCYAGRRYFHLVGSFCQMLLLQIRHEKTNLPLFSCFLILTSLWHFGQKIFFAVKFTNAVRTSLQLFQSLMIIVR